MRKIILSISLLFAGVSIYAQQDAQFTQNMFNKLSTNPGSAGHNGGICGTLLSRQQWTGFEGNPKTNLISVDTRIKDHHGVGLTVFQDELGIEKSFSAKVAYAYTFNLPGLPGELGIGIEGSYFGKSFDNNFRAIDDPLLDPSIPNGEASANTIDVGAGLYYQIPGKLYVGLSALHIPQSSLTDEVNGDDEGVGALNFQQERTYYLMAGYEYSINDKFILKPSILTKTTTSSTQLDVNALLEYNNKFWGGVTYRLQDAIGILAGVNIGEFIEAADGLKLGISYDLTTSSIADHSNGSFEIMLRYCTNFSSSPKSNGYRSVRTL